VRGIELELARARESQRQHRPAYTSFMRLEEYPLPLRMLGYFRVTVLYALALSVAIACLIYGTNLGRIIGLILLAICLLIAVRFARGRSAKPS